MEKNQLVGARQMDEKKRLEVDIGHLSEETLEWAKVLGIDLDDREFTPLVNQHMNDYLAKKMKELREQQGSKKETSFQEEKAAEEYAPYSFKEEKRKKESRKNHENDY